MGEATDVEVLLSLVILLVVLGVVVYEYVKHKLKH
jgi:hypothetical protein